MREIVLVVHNIRSCHNVGSLLRTADGLGINDVILTGYTPYPAKKDDKRLPHIIKKIDQQIHKTALGAESMQPWKFIDSINETIEYLKTNNFTVIALEQTDNAFDLSEYTPPDKLALIVGREVEGLEDNIIKQCDLALFIPMFGKKESFNVCQAAAIALYHCRMF